MIGEMFRIRNFNFIWCMVCWIVESLKVICDFVLIVLTEFIHLTLRSELSSEVISMLQVESVETDGDFLLNGDCSTSMYWSMVLDWLVWK